MAYPSFFPGYMCVFYLSLYFNYFAKSAKSDKDDSVLSYDFSSVFFQSKR